MANTASKVIAIAEAEVGYLEKKNGNNLYDKTANAGDANYTKYGYEMHQVYPSVMDYPAAWCDAFVDWCFYKAFGVSNAKALLGGNFDDYTPSSAQLYKNKGAYYKSNPKVGDQIFFNNGTRICHTGLVYKVDGSYVYTIEGNTSNASGVVANGGGVAKKKYTLNYAKIDGYGRPAYDSVANTSKTETPEANVPSANDEKVIWDFLSGKGLNDFAVAGVIGNLFAESGLKSNNLQNSYESKLGMTDASYTEAVDSGSYTNFVKDAAGYGLAQWTYYTRKQGLHNLAKSKNVSISNLAMQLEWLWSELQGYAAVMSVLKVATSVKQASDIVLTGFEKPADQSDAVKTKRAGYGQTYYNKYAKNTTAAGSSSTTSNSVVPSVASSNPNLKSGSTGAQVTLLQHDLNYVMKSGLDVDGSFGPKTKAALIAFQKKYGLTQDGIYGSKSEAQMKSVLTGKTTSVIPTLASASPNLRKGSTGAQVKYLQQDLNYVMNSGLSVDGDFGAKTDAAVRAFQKKYGLVVDGVYGSKSQAKMKTLLK